MRKNGDVTELIKFIIGLLIFGLFLLITLPLLIMGYAFFFDRPDQGTMESFIQLAEFSRRVAADVTHEDVALNIKDGFKISTKGGEDSCFINYICLCKDKDDGCAKKTYAKENVGMEVIIEGNVYTDDDNPYNGEIWGDPSFWTARNIDVITVRVEKQENRILISIPETETPQPASPAEQPQRVPGVTG